MKKYFFLLFLVTLLFLAGCAGPLNNGAEQKGNIYGVITEKASAEPMRAAGVSLYTYWSDYNKRGTLILKTVTYDDGHYEFNDLTPKEYTLIVDMEGFDTFKSTVTVENGRTARCDMQMSKTKTYLTMTTSEPEIRGNTVTFKGTYAYNSSYDPYGPKECGFVYGTERKPSLITATIIKAEKKGNFSAVIMIERKGVYYVRSYATNGYGTEYGEERSFEFLGLPGVTTLAVSNIRYNSATLSGQIDFKGDPEYTEKGFVYSKSFPRPTIDDPASSTTRIRLNGSSDEFSANVDGLTKDATYYVRAYAINSIGTVYGSPVQFITTELPYYDLEGISVQKNDIGILQWNDAKVACKNSRVGGFSNWRLPTKGESYLMYINRSKIGGFSTSCYWVSDGDHCYINISNGQIDSTPNASDYFAFGGRCVRTL